MNKGYTPPKPEEEMKLMELRQKVTKTFLKGGANRFEDICPETVVMLAYLNNKTRTIKEIEADLDDNDALCFKVREKMVEYGLSPEENPDFDLTELGINDSVCITFREITEQGNALFIELILSQFSYYVNKLEKLNYKRFDDFLNDFLNKKELLKEKKTRAKKSA